MRVKYQTIGLIRQLFFVYHGVWQYNHHFGRLCFPVYFNPILKDLYYLWSFIYLLDCGTDIDLYMFVRIPKLAKQCRLHFIPFVHKINQYVKIITNMCTSNKHIRIYQVQFLELPIITIFCLATHFLTSQISSGLIISLTKNLLLLFFKFKYKHSFNFNCSYILIVSQVFCLQSRKKKIHNKKSSF